MQKDACKVISVVNQKGGVGKTTTTVSLGIGLAKAGKKVLLIDADPQGSMTVSLGYDEPDEIDMTLASVMGAMINEEEVSEDFGILHHKEGIDLLPANIELSGLEVSLVNVMSRETLLRGYIEMLREKYDYILIDCMSSLGMITINALVASDSVVIPVQVAYLPVKGLQQLIRTIYKVKRQLNRRLEIDGILLTMRDIRTKHAKEIEHEVRETYGEYVHIFDVVIPLSVRAAETTAKGKSIFVYDPKGQVSEAYQAVAEEVLNR